MEKSTQQSFMENPLDDPRVQGIDKPWPIALKWGIIGALAGIAIVFVGYLTGSMDAEKIQEQMAGGGSLAGGLLGMLLTGIGWVVYTFIYYKAVTEHRNQLGGSISFGKGFKVAFLSALVKAGILLLFAFLFYKFVVPSYLEAMMDGMAQAMSEATQGDTDALDMIMTMYGYMFSPVGMALGSFFGTLVGGAILSLIAAGIGQKN